MWERGEKGLKPLLCTANHVPKITSATPEAVGAAMKAGEAVEAGAGRKWKREQPWKQQRQPPWLQRG